MSPLIATELVQTIVRSFSCLPIEGDEPILIVRPPLGNEAHDLSLAVGQRSEPRVGSLARTHLLAEFGQFLAGAPVTCLEGLLQVLLGFLQPTEVPEKEAVIP